MPIGTGNFASGCAFAGGCDGRGWPEVLNRSEHQTLARGTDMMSKRPLPVRGWIAFGWVALLLWTRPFWHPNPPPGQAAPLGSAAEPAEPGVLWIHYHERPPYYVTTATGVTGLCLDPVRRALERAGLNHRWQVTPPQRQLLWLRTSTRELHAAVGWFRTLEREQWARFSEPIYQDGPWVAVVRRQEDRVGSVTNAVGLLQVPGWTVLTRAGYSHGEWLDRLFASLPVVRRTSPSDPAHLLAAVAAGRADCVFMAREEAETLLGLQSRLGASLRLVTLTDSPAGPTRHVMFGPAVPASWIQRFNDALREHEQPEMHTNPTGPAGGST
ncbi:amino acid ABC transporter substrate-binding protein [Limisphaera ngatamarikiensis]|uniref:Amino acid ABC transporter substrate-binding protein n=2 Tax=Limisphaera ngatamarikiensis TaxID=1324935 RepID=A0A6M1RST7_9BACT|nr:transporter substrate-binding domain-containing protein [Limisphaera ngatamarikiensis]NGO38421.1 amino acid ABC transporter substrate-binding protein [Limisphaera ngatamarikiensis]